MRCRERPAAFRRRLRGPVSYQRQDDRDKNGEILERAHAKKCLMFALPYLM